MPVPTDHQYRLRARELYGDDVEITEDATVRRATQVHQHFGESTGAYVQAWIYLSDRSLPGWLLRILPEQPENKGV